MKILNIHVFLGFLLVFINTLGHTYENLTELVDKRDFVNFKKAYENQNITDQQKNELLDRVNKIIDTNSTRLKPYFFGSNPNLNAGKILKMQSKVSLFFSGLLFGMGGAFSTLFAYLISQDSKNIFNRYSMTAANFVPDAHYANYGQYIGERDARISSKNIEFRIVIPYMTSLGLLSGSLLLYLGRIYKKNLLIYKQWKKALKMRALIQGDSDKFKLLKSGIIE